MALTDVSTWARGVWLAAFCLIALWTRTAVACSCEASGPPCQNAFRVDAVFIGTARNISTVGNTADPPFPRQLVVFTIERAFRGPSTDELGERWINTIALN
jgi:hypothetical protein